MYSQRTMVFQERVIVIICDHFEHIYLPYKSEWYFKMDIPNVLSDKQTIHFQTIFLLLCVRINVIPY